MTSPISPEAKAFLLASARNAIAEHLGLQKDVANRPNSAILSEPRGAFVTLEVEGRLRGCIGRIESRDALEDTVIEMAHAAAFADPRFPTLTPREFDSMTIEVSVLSPPREIAGVADIKVGRDGLIVEGDGARGLLLPQVAEEWSWSPQEFLEQTCHKAGLHQDAWKEDNVRLLAFSAQVIREGS